MNINQTQFTAGTYVQMATGVKHIITGRGFDGRLKLLNPKQKTTMYRSPESLENDLLNGRLTVIDPGLEKAPPTRSIAADISTLAEARQAEAMRRFDYVMAANAEHATSESKLKPVIAEVAERISDKKAPSPRSVQRWTDAYRAFGVRGLVAEHRGNTNSRIDFEVESLIDRALEERYFTPLREPLTEAYLCLKGLIKQANKGRSEIDQLIVPTYNTLRLRVANIDRKEVIAARYGKTYANNMFRVHGQHERPTRPMQVVQMDHTILDINVSSHGIRIGKPVFSWGLCPSTGAIVGMNLGFDPPGYQAVMQTLNHIIMPKTNLEAFCPEAVNGWDMHGIPESLMLDNGREFTGFDLKNAAAHLGIDLRYSPPYQPWFKSQVERAFGILRTQLISKMYGKTFTVKEEQADYDAEDGPMMDLVDLRRVVTKWIVDVYHQRAYPATGLPPAEAWRQGIAQNPPRDDVSADEVQIYLGKTERRKLHPYGIELYGLKYTSVELGMLRQQVIINERVIARNKMKGASEKLLVKLDPTNLGRIWVLDPVANLYVVAYAIAKEYAEGLTLHRHNLNKQQAKLVTEGYVDPVALLNAHRQIDQMIKDLSLHKAAALGKALGRLLESERADLHPVTEGATTRNLDHEREAVEEALRRHEAGLEPDGIPSDSQSQTGTTSVESKAEPTMEDMLANLKAGWNGGNNS